MSGVVEIPLQPSQATIFTTTLNQKAYVMRLTYNTEGDGSWILDIGDANQVPLVAGIPLVSGTDLLAQYNHLGFGGALVVTTDRNAGEIPTFDGLGVTSHLYFVTP